MSTTIGALCWNVRKIVSKGLYNYAVVPEHPHATKHGYVLEHRIVVENNLKRLLTSDEVVHHINGDKKDNRFENLEVLTNSNHARQHALEQGRAACELRCPWCQRLFQKWRNQTHLVKPSRYTCCSKSCQGSFSGAIRLGRITTQLEQAISVNIVREYRVYSHDNTEATVLTGAVETTRLPPEMVKI